MFEDLPEWNVHNERLVDLSSCTHDELRRALDLLFSQLGIVAVKGQRKGWSDVMMLRRNP